MTLDGRVEKEMGDMLGRELARYVDELWEIATARLPSQSDGSGDSQPHSVLTLDEVVNALPQ